MVQTRLKTGILLDLKYSLLILGHMQISLAHLTFFFFISQSLHYHSCTLPGSTISLHEFLHYFPLNSFHFKTFNSSELKPNNHQDNIGKHIRHFYQIHDKHICTDYFVIALS